MSIDRILSRNDIQALKAQIAQPGTPAYANLDAITAEMYNKATDLGAKIAAGYSPEAIEAEKKNFMEEGLDESSRKLLERVTIAARDRVEQQIAEGKTVSTLDGLILWNKEEPLSAAMLRSIENTGYQPTKGNIDKLTEYYNYGRVAGALNDIEDGKKISGKDVDKIVEEIFSDHMTAGERIGQRARKAAQVTGTGVGLITAIPLAIIGGAGGFVVGLARTIGNAIDGTDREAVMANRRLMGYAESPLQIEESVEAIRAHKHKNYIGKGILWGAGSVGGISGLIGATVGNGLASIGIGRKDKEIAANKIAIRSGIIDGLKARGIEVDAKEQGKGKDKEKDGEKDSKSKDKSGMAERLGSAAAAGHEYYFGMDDEKKKKVLAEIEQALGVERGALIEKYFSPPQDNAYVNISEESLKELAGRKAVIAPDFASSETALAQQKREMEGYKRALEEQGITNVEVIQITLEGCDVPQWSIVGKGLTAAQVGYAQEEYDRKHPQAEQAAVLSRSGGKSASLEETKTPVADQPSSDSHAANTTISAPVQAISVTSPASSNPQNVSPEIAALKEEVGVLREKINHLEKMIPQMDKIEIGVANKQVNAQDVVRSITVPTPEQKESVQELAGGAAKTTPR